MIKSVEDILNCDFNSKLVCCMWQVTAFKSLELDCCTHWNTVHSWCVLIQCTDQSQDLYTNTRSFSSSIETSKVECQSKTYHFNNFFNHTITDFQYPSISNSFVQFQSVITPGSNQCTTNDLKNKSIYCFFLKIIFFKVITDWWH